MNRAVTALQHSFQAAVFPELDSARSLLGARMDAALAGGSAAAGGACSAAAVGQSSDSAMLFAFRSPRCGSCCTIMYAAEALLSKATI